MKKKMQTALYLFLNVTDTVIYETNTINRDSVKLIQTPQLSNTKTLIKCFRYALLEFTDESSAIKSI
jgi:2-C-methyl-D-erythritol 4-phosphate cytidylyltransferase/2-C-methyl-D-erythritol 2,4-cyclodiphosphate synthase